MILIDITDSDLSSSAQSDGDDILFTSSDGTSKLAHEIENYTTGTGALRSWVKVPSVSTSVDTDIYMYYGNSGASNQESVADVWTDYSMVWHMSEDPSGSSPQTFDSTVNAFDGTTNRNQPKRAMMPGVGRSLWPIEGLRCP